MMAQLKAENEEKMKNMQLQHEREMAELRASLGQASSAEVDRLKALHAEEIK